jgi:hypothetical protein
MAIVPRAETILSGTSREFVANDVVPSVGHFAADFLPPPADLLAHRLVDIFSPAISAAIVGDQPEGTID